MKKSISLLLFLLLLTGTKSNAQNENLVSANQLVVVANHPGPVIGKDIYGHFSEHLGACIYGGIWVGTDSKIPNTYGIRNDVLFALREIKIPNLRWPGGFFADTYHWKDGMGPQEKRASIVNTMRQYSTYLGNYAGNRLNRVACGPSDFNYTWTETLMKDGGTRAMFQGLSIHYYSIVDRYDPQKTKDLVVDEWGNWFNVELGVVKPVAFKGFTLKDGVLLITMPSKSVVVLELTK